VAVLEGDLIARRDATVSRVADGPEAHARHLASDPGERYAEQVAAGLRGAGAGAVVVEGDVDDKVSCSRLDALPQPTLRLRAA
jgi:hypothetical protein